ncbi:cobyrinic acid a,c-diamide synthase [Puniceibacterium antarcticum]|uniref:Cobyrinic acid a,c-diamide synthase n=1 Tax=Puniceibacterium antarcticum TaxID=1206336 RepID=A0A2G8RK33_9RHOB|nr:ParA family protein [Puniceibacterium antarcticum]PIL21448.1 cobyrinic acid a,c-diamide synthase [Puniceibacterium antarcticum]
MHTIVVANNKGGVGKTTIATQIAFHLRHAGHSVVAVDLDGQVNLTSALPGVRVVGNALGMVETGAVPPFTTEPGELVLIEGDAEVPVSSADAVLRGTAQGLRSIDGPEFCVIDTPPTFSAVVYGAMLSADYMLAPIELKKFSLDGVEGVLKAFVQVQELNEGITFLGLLPSRFDAVKQSERDTLQLVAESYSALIIPHAIRNRVGYEMAEAEGLPVFEVTTRSGKEAAAEFGAFFAWLRTALQEEA